MDKEQPKTEVTPSRSALGRGMAALLPTSEHETNRDRHLGISMCSIDEIQANEFQPRRVFNDETLAELAQSIKANGLIQPLIVRKAVQGGYQLIAGERRWRAAKLAGLKHVPIVIRRTTDKEALELALIENIQREDLNCLDTALAYYQLINDFDLKQEDVSSRVGKDRTTITNHLRLLKLPQTVQTWLRDNFLTYGHGKALAGVENAALLERLGREAVEKKWSVRELENQIQKIKNLEQARGAQLAGNSSPTPMDPLELRLRNIGRDLSTKLSTKVQLRGNEKHGKIMIEYFNPEDLERVLAHLLR